jgi:hypothetical protein
MLTMNRQGTVFFIFYSVINFILTSNPERLLSFKVDCTKFVKVFVSLSGRQTFVRRQVWKAVKVKPLGKWSSH